MPRQLIAIALAAGAALVAASAGAQAQPAPNPPQPAAADPSAAPPTAPAAADPSSAPPPSAPAEPSSAPPSVPGSPDAGASAPAVPPATATAPAAEPAASGDDVGDQAISAELGVAAGNRLTPGGLRITGQFLYQLSDEDWFDGGASFTFGSGTPACFRDRQDMVICNHGLADGTGVELTASIRRMFPAQGQFHPFARLGVGLGLVRFSNDDVSGFTIPAHGGGGVRIAVAPSIALIAEADLALGFGSFSRGIGSQVQLGLAISAGVEFRLR